MAITITGLPTNDELVAGYNPNYIEFETNVAGTPLYATVSVGIGWLAQTVVIEITPSTNNVFYFNYQSIVRDAMRESDVYLENTFLFPDISTISNALFIDNNISTLLSLTIIIYDAAGIMDNTTDPSAQDFYFLKASRQVLNSTFMSNYSAPVGSGGFISMLNPVDTVKVWAGFPIDVQFDALDSTSQFIDLNGALFSKTLTTTAEDRMLRLCLIDVNGNELTGLNDNASNNIEITLVGGGGNSAFTAIDYVTPSYPDCSKYIRWKNLEGGDSYWLFEDVYTIEKNRSNKKRINRIFTDLELAKSRNVSLGNDTSEVLIVTQTTTEEYENTILNSLISSPIIELYKGDDKWQRIDLIGHEGQDSSKQVGTNYKFSFDLGVLYNQVI